MRHRVHLAYGRFLRRSRTPPRASRSGFDQAMGVTRCPFSLLHGLAFGSRGSHGCPPTPCPLNHSFLLVESASADEESDFLSFGSPAEEAPRCWRAPACSAAANRTTRSEESSVKED